MLANQRRLTAGTGRPVSPLFRSWWRFCGGTSMHDPFGILRLTPHPDASMGIRGIAASAHPEDKPHDADQAGDDDLEMALADAAVDPQTEEDAGDGEGG